MFSADIVSIIYSIFETPVAAPEPELQSSSHILCFSSGVFVFLWLLLSAVRYVSCPVFPEVRGPYTELGAQYLRSLGKYGVICQVVYPVDVDRSEGHWWSWQNSYLRRTVIDALGERFLKSVYLGRLFFSFRAHPCRYDVASPMTPIYAWPIVVFSHGLFGSSDIYLNTARQIASAGCVVILLDHQDGSGLGCCDREGNVIPYCEPEVPDKDPPGGINRKKTQRFRRPMIAQRSKELDGILDIILSPNESRPWQWARVLQNCDRHRIIMAGHSFGAATIAHMLSSPEIANRPECDNDVFCMGMILLDLWGAPLPEQITLHPSIPIFSCLADQHYHNPQQGPIIAEFHRQCPKNITQTCWVEKMRHPLFSDVGVFQRGNGGPNHDVWVDAMLNWINQVINGKTPGKELLGGHSELHVADF
eukprot:gene639-234_t